MNVCMKCQAKFEPKKLGVTVIETADTPPRPFRIWRADLYGCPICSSELITAFSHAPLIERHESGFEQILADVKQGEWYVLHNPAYLAQTVGYETKYVRSYART